MPLSTSPAYDRLLTDDRHFHVVFLVLGGLFTVLLLLFSAFSWIRFRRTRARGFERKSYFSFATVSLVLGLLMTVVFAANVTSVVNPGQTLAGTTFSPVGQEWLRSGHGEFSPALQQAIDDRLAWQRPKAVICAILLVAFVTLAVLLWRTLIRRSRSGRPVRKVRHWLLLAAAVASVAVCGLLMVMVIGNTQGALYPLFLTVVAG